MNKMDEDEIIEIVKDFISYIRFDEKPKYGVRQQYMAIENLLDLYQKEREKNNKYIIHLTDEQYKKVIDLAQKDVEEKWKNKIKAKIKEYEEINMDIFTFEVAEDLKVLLEEE